MKSTMLAIVEVGTFEDMVVQVSSSMQVLGSMEVSGSIQEGTLVDIVEAGKFGETAVVVDRECDSSDISFLFVS